MIPRFLLLGDAAGGLVTLFATECAGEPLPESLSEDMASQTRAVLKAVHDKGVAHGDVELRNFVYDEGRVFILDFGWCKFKSEVKDWDALVEKERTELDALLKDVTKPLKAPKDKISPPVASRKVKKMASGIDVLSG